MPARTGLSDQAALALLREAIDNLSDSFILYDADDRVVLTNRRFHEVFPFLDSQDEIIGQSMEHLVRLSVENGAVTDPTLRPDNREEWIKWFIGRRRSHPLSITEDTWPNGRWDLVKEQRLSSGAFVSVRTDITDRKRAEFALKEHKGQLSEELDRRGRHLEAVLTNIAQGIIVLDSELRVVLTNPGIHDLVGYPRELGKPGTHVGELVRDRLRKGFYLPGEIECGADEDGLVERRLEAYRRLTRESYRHEMPDGRMVEIDRQKLKDGSIICTFTDVTEEMRAEKELAHQRDALYQHEKLAALGMLLAGVAHELNNPLSVILGQASILEKAAADAADRTRAESVRQAAERAAKIVKTFLAMARDEPPSRRIMELNSVIEQALEVTGYALREAGIKMRLELDANLPPLLGDPDQLNQVVANLIINAAQALAEHGGERLITLASRYLPANGEIELEVRDTGPGIPEEIRKNIFDPFFTTKPVGRGTGIGLSICHSMVAVHGGSIVVGDAPGGGASFLVRLPCDREAEALTSGSQIPQSVVRARVLIVDDEPEICELLAAFLEGTGLESVTAITGAEALLRLSSSGIDAIICDLRVGGMDAASFYQAVEERYPALARRFIFADGDQLDPDVQRFVREKNLPCLNKPFLPDQVRRLVLQVVGATEASAAP